MKLTILSLLLALTTLSPAGAAPIQIRDDMGRVVTLPAMPQRIVSTYDVDVTIPLIELGAPPIASHGRLRLNGKPYLLSSRLLTGVDFDNSDIAFIGAASKPVPQPRSIRAQS
jgi:iron complex transport system substrate-binding protein